MTASVNNKSDELIEKALRLDPSESPEEYLQCLNEAANADPYNFKPHVLFGSYFQKKEQYREAAECYLHALNIDYTLKNDPNEASKVYLNLGKIYQNLGEKTKSLIYYKDYIGLFPDTPHANRLAPQIYVKLKNFENWFSSYKKARVALDEGKHKEAEKLFKFCIKVNPSFAWSGFYLAKSYIGRGITASVVDVLKKCLKHRDHYCFKYELYKFEFDNSLELEENLLNELREEAPYYIPGILLEAKRLASIGENDIAAELFKNVVTVIPGTDFAQEALDGLFKIQSIEQVEEPVEEVKPVEPPKPKARKGLLHKTPRKPVEEVVEPVPQVVIEQPQEEVQTVDEQQEIFEQPQEEVQTVDEQQEIFEQPQEEVQTVDEQQEIFEQPQEEVQTVDEQQEIFEQPQEEVQTVDEQQSTEQASLDDSSLLEFSAKNIEQVNPANVDPTLDFTVEMEKEAKWTEEKEAEIRAQIQAESQGIIDEAVSKADKITEDALAEAEIIKETAKKEYEELEQKLRAELAEEKEKMLAEVEAMKAEIKEKAEAEATEKIEKAEEEAEAIRQQAEEDAEEARKEGQISAQVLRKRIEIEERYEELLLKLNKERKSLRLKSLDDAEKIIRAAEKRRDEVISRAETVSAKIEKLSKDAEEKYSMIYQTAIDDSCKMIEDIRQKAEEEGQHIIELANEERKKILQNANDRAKEILDKGLAKTYDVSDDSVNKIVMDYGSIADVTRQKIEEFCVELRNSFDMIFNQNVVEIKNKFNLNLDEAIDDNGESMRKFSESLKEDLAKTDISDVFAHDEGLEETPVNLLKDTKSVEDMTSTLSDKLDIGSQGVFPPTDNLTDGIYAKDESNVLEKFSEPTEDEIKAEIKEKVESFVGDTFDGIDEENDIPSEDEIHDDFDELPPENVEEDTPEETQELVISSEGLDDEPVDSEEKIETSEDIPDEHDIPDDIPSEESMSEDDSISFEDIPSEDSGEEDDIKNIFSSFMDDEADE